MRDTIDFGIDLGTTNSAIAVVENGEVVVIKSNDGWDITPSAIWMPKRDLIYVGRKAQARVEDDPDNAAAEFKLEMGLADARRDFAKAGVALTPQQLSAEILKSLRDDAAHDYGAPPNCAVITVPAAFTLNQNKATTKAAELAGFSQVCPLVQEPTAAAFAYGFNDKTDRGYWMVFDFGGGTFDAAVVSKRDGDLRVLNHAGDRHLGGKLIDWALVERILAPEAARTLKLNEFRRDNPLWRTNFARLKQVAEEAKIELSRANKVTVIKELIDDRGSSETFEYALDRDTLDTVAEEFYVRAINLCRKALTEAALKDDAIDRLLLVGGVTLAPGLRERLADPQHGLGIELDISLDPTTVVARGAAIFASTIRRPQAASPAPAPGEFAVTLSYEPRVNSQRTTFAGSLHGSSAVDWTVYSVTISNPAGQPPFRSARIPLNARGAFAVEVDLDPHRTSTFTIELTDGRGALCKLTPNTVSITHGDTPEFGGVLLAHSLGIQLADRAFAPILRKGTTLPTGEVKKVFRTTGALHRADTDAMIRIPVVQGERSRGDRNREVGMLQIRPRDVRIDLPAGSEVEVTFVVDISSLVTVVAEVPLVETRFEAEINLDDVRTPSAEVLHTMRRDMEDRLDSLRGAAMTVKSAEAQRRLAKLDAEGAVRTAREQVQAASVDAGAAAAAEERLRDIQAELDDIEDAVELPTLVQELRDLLAEATQRADQTGTAADRQELTALQARAQDAIKAQDSVAVRALVDRTTLLVVELERRNADWPVKVFYSLRATLVGTSSSADALIADAERAIAAGDRQALDASNQRLFRLIPPEDHGKIIGVTA
jgi:molecular chaperone DnaK